MREAKLEAAAAKDRLRPRRPSHARPPRSCCLLRLDENSGGGGGAVVDDEAQPSAARDQGTA